MQKTLKWISENNLNELETDFEGLDDLQEF